MKLYLKKGDQWYESSIDLKKVYTSVHSGAKYGASANKLVNEMFANVLELAFQHKVNLTQPMVITDYGCGQSKATNVLAEVISANANKINRLIKSGCSMNEILQQMSPAIKTADAKEICGIIPQISEYKNIIVQRYDIGIPEYSEMPAKRADIVFCNDVLEHIPEDELSYFIKSLEMAGRYVFASISLRDAVNYMAIPETLLWERAVKVDGPRGIILKESSEGMYIFSLHVSILPQNKWQALLGEKWTLLSAQDYTAVSAMNFVPSAEYKDSKKELIAQVGFADFIPFPTKIGSRYEQDPILWRRTAEMQPQKHIQKLNVLEGFPESPFKRREQQESIDFLTFIGAKIKRNDDGLWKIEELPDYLEKLTKLEKICKEGSLTDEEVQNVAREIVKHTSENC